MNKTLIAAASIDIGQALGKFSTETVKLLNAVVGSIAGLLAVVAIIYIILWAVKRNSKPEVVEEANRRIKNAVITLIIIVIVATAGFTLINTVLLKLAESPFDITAFLR